MVKCPNCNNPIDEHEAGRETDACIAIVVMKWVPDPEYKDGEITFFNKSGFGKTGTRWDRARHASTEIEEAWEIVNTLVGMNWKVFIGMDMKDGNYCRLEWHDPFDPKWKQFMTRGTSMPLIICRAALKAVPQ